MGYIEALVLAVIQGLTEFLPVSSSGHLVLAQHWFGQFGETSLLYDIILHLATVTAILMYFRHDLLTLGLGYVGWTTTQGSLFQGFERQTIHYVLLASIPTAIIGLGIRSIGLETLVQPSVVAVMLLITGVILWLGRGRNSARGIQDMGVRDALVIGFVRGIAVLPGISRSGSTIASGVLLGLDRELSARFSLLISMPAIVGAAILEIGQAMNQIHEPIGIYVAGMVLAALVGYGSISLIIKLVRQDHFHLFSYYLWPLGMSILLWSMFK
jgi:undecaprenyl-diphosphatase